MTCNTVGDSNRNYIDVKIFSACANKYADCLSSKWTASARAIPYCNWRVVLLVGSRFHRNPLVVCRHFVQAKGRVLPTLPTRSQTWRCLTVETTRDASERSIRGGAPYVCFTSIRGVESVAKTFRLWVDSGCLTGQFGGYQA